MNLIALLFLLTFIFIVFISNYILFRNPKSNVNRAFYFFLVIIAVNLLSKFGFLTSENIKIKLFWAIINSLWPFILYSQLLFIIEYTNRIRLIRVKILSRILGIIVLLLSFSFIYFHITSYINKATVDLINKSSIFKIASVIFTLTLSLFTLLVSISYFIKVNQKFLKIQSALIIIGLSIPLITTQITESVLPFLFKLHVQDYSIIGIIFSIIILGYAINKYRLFKVSPITALDNILKTIPDSLFLIDNNLKIIFINYSAVQLTGYSENELKNMYLYELINKSYKYFDKLNNKLKQNPVKSLDFELHTKDDKIIQIILSASILKQKNSEIGYVYIISDISDKVKLLQKNHNLQLQLFQSQKMEAIGQLAGGIAHDFNNLIGAISIIAEDVKDEFGEQEAYLNETMKNILISTEHAKDLTGKLLAFAKKGKFELKAIDVHDAIKEVINIINYTIDKKIKIIELLNAEKTVINGDFRQLQNAILNIAINSRDAMPDGGMLTFITKNINKKKFPKRLSSKIKNCENYFYMEITDSGFGIDQDIKDKVFEPFFTTKASGKGSGLGLASVYGTIINHGGFIEIESEKNKGTKMQIYLPCIIDEIQLNNETDFKLEKNNKSLNVLLIDDDDSFRKACEMTLTKLTFKVNGFSHPGQAILFYKKNYKIIDVILLDLIMPEISGYECFIKLKKINPLLKVMVMTGFSEDGEATKLIEAGAVAYLQKPFKKNKLINTINLILKNSL